MPPPPPPFRRYERLVRKMAQGCLARMPGNRTIGADDLFAEGWLVYRRTCDKWQPERGAFITIFWWSLLHGFAKITARENRWAGRRTPWLAKDGTEDGSLANMPDRADGRQVRGLNGRLTREAHMVLRALTGDGAFASWELAYYGRRGSGKARLRRAARWVGADAAEIIEELREAMGM